MNCSTGTQTNLLMKGGVDMIECITDYEEIEQLDLSCGPCPVDSPTCNPNVPTCDPNLP